MKKVFITTLVPLLFFTACKNREAKLYPDTGETFAQIQRVELSEEIAGERIRCTLKGQYPQVTGLQNEEVQVKINELLEERTAESSMQELQNCPSEFSDLLIADDELLHETTTKFGLHTNEKGLLSLTYSSSSQLEGAAHPSNDVIGLTIDLRTGDLYTLEDIVSESYDIKSALREKMISSTYNVDVSQESLDGIEAENSAYYFKRSNLVFTNLFDVHAIQGVTIEIPLSELAEYAKEDGPIPQLLAE